MEDIKYVDISVNDIVGDIPTSNSLRIKPTKKELVELSPLLQKDFSYNIC